MEHLFKLGDRVRDSLTGFEGIVIGRSEWLTGCNTIGLKSEQLEGGKAPELWLDQTRGQLIVAQAYTLPRSTGRPATALDAGGPMMSTPQQAERPDA